MSLESEARHQMQRRELERHITCVKSNSMYHCFAFFVFDLFCVMQEKHQKILLSFWNKVLFCRMFVLLLERDRSVIRSHQDLIRFNNNIPWLARTIYNYANVFFVFVFFCDTSKASENLTFILNKVSFCRVVVFIL